MTLTNVGGGSDAALRVFAGRPQGRCTKRKLKPIRVAREPNRIPTLNNQASLLIQLGRATEAITILNHAQPSKIKKRAINKWRVEDFLKTQTICG